MPPSTRIASAFLALALAAAAQVGLSAWQGAAVHPADIDGVASVSFSPNRRNGDPVRGDMATVPEIAADLRAVRAIATRVRTYTVSQNLDAVPALAEAEGMRVTLGMWVDDHDPARTEREFATAAALARRHRSVDEVIVGNEAILRNDATPAGLAALMRRMRAATGKPVSTGETWDVWLDHPELAEAADFVTAHVLPYWEGVEAGRAVEVALGRYEQLVRAFPGKRVVVGEIGWPSGKFNRGAARANLAAQAVLVRDFAAAARARGIAYNVIEAFDQPWKTMEGDVGPHWGMLDAHREAKFPLSGPVSADPLWAGKAAAGGVLGVLLSAWFLLRRRNAAAEALAVALAGQAVGFAAARAFAVPFEEYASAGLVASWLFAVPLLLLLGGTAFDRMREMAEVLLGRRPGRLLSAPVVHPAGRTLGDATPKVSIHVPACRENPAVVIQTLEAMARLDYPAFEVLAVVNNTPEAHLVEPVRDACARLGDRFRFVHLPQVSGFKAGALNRALALTAPDAEVIAVVDADYVVEPDWLRDLAPVFADPGVGLVQAPQEHRDEREGWLKKAMNSEYAGFFDVGMVQRNEDDAIVAHGTMLMVRRHALELAGGWGERFICEDTELGLRLVEHGWTTHYTARRYGAGLLPDTLRAYRRQRDRWAYGAMRIMLAHWRHMLPGSRTLTAAQKYHFVAGWGHWVADAVAVALAVSNLGYVSFMLATGLGEPPPAVVTAATGVAAAASLAHMFALYAARVRRGAGAAALAALAGVGLQMTVARAVFRGLVLANLPFHVTAKGGRPSAGLARLAKDSAAEFLLGAGLLTGAALAFLGNHHRVLETDLFAALLAVQSVPFLVAVGMGAAECGGLALARMREARRAAPRAIPADAVPAE